MSIVELPFESRFCSAPDGLKLHVREYGSTLDPGVPVVCLAGLTRNSADFGRLASALAAGLKGAKRRRSPDYRGRGLSAYDRNWKNYSLEIENADVLSVLAAMEIEAAIFIGTSRGGLHTMLLSATRPAVIRGAVLNDIGPVLEPRGMARIRGYVGMLPEPRSVAEAVDLLKETMSERFNDLSEADWEAYARITFTDAVGRICQRYDRNLMKPLESLDLEQPLPTLWPRFDGLRDVPLLIIRGANSDFSRPKRFGKWPAGTPERRSIPSKVKAMRRFCSTRKRLTGFAHLSQRPIAPRAKTINRPRRITSSRSISGTAR